MKVNIVIRKFRLSDYNTVTTLWNESGLPYRPSGRDSLERIAREIKQGCSMFLVAEADGNVVGTLLGTHDGRKGWLNRLAVKKEFRQSSIARRLVLNIEKRFNKLGIDVIACLIEGENTSSMEVFKRLGYIKSDVTYFSKRKGEDS